MTTASNLTKLWQWLPRAFADTYSAFLSSTKASIGEAEKNAVSGQNFAKTNLEAILHPHVRSRWALPAVRYMTPAVIESILREALTGESPRREQELYTLMEQTWPRLAKNIQEIKNAVIGLEWALLHPANSTEDVALAEIIHRARLNMRGDPTHEAKGWEGMLRHLMDAWFRGVAMVELDWRPTAHDILPVQARPIPPWHYGWSKDTGRLRLYTVPGDPNSALDIPRQKFLVAVHNTSGGHPAGGALLRPLAWWWCAANFSSEWFLNFAQIFGQPFRWATYDRADPDAAATLAEIMQHMGSTAWGVGPEGTKVEILDSARGAADNPQLALLDRADRACDILLLGQTLTTDVGESGSRALGDVHAAVRSDVVDAVAHWLAEILNEQLIPALHALNRGTPPDYARLPYWEPARKQGTDAKLLAETIEILVRAGLPIPRAWAYASLDIPEPQVGEPTITPPTPDLAPALAQMPVEARAYILAHLRESAR